MKGFSTRIMKVDLVSLSLLLALSLYPLVRFLHLWSQIPFDGPFKEAIYPATILLVFLCLSSIQALMGGLLSTIEYEKNRVFSQRALGYLQVSFLGFLGSFFVCLLLLFLTLFNDLPFWMGIFSIGFALGFFLLSQVAYILSTIIKEGLNLQRENDLTI